MLAPTSASSLTRWRPGSPAAEALADLPIAIECCVDDKKIRDWVGNRDVENQMKARLDDYFIMPP